MWKDFENIAEYVNKGKKKLFYKILKNMGTGKTAKKSHKREN